MTQRRCGTAIDGHPVKFLTTSFSEKILLIVRRVHKEHKCQRMKFPHAVRCWVLAFNNNCLRSHLPISQALLLHFETPSFCRTAPSNFRSVSKALVYTTHLIYKPVRYEIARSHGIGRTCFDFHRGSRGRTACLEMKLDSCLLGFCLLDSCCVIFNASCELSIMRRRRSLSLSTMSTSCRRTVSVKVRVCRQSTCIFQRHVISFSCMCIYFNISLKACSCIGHRSPAKAVTGPPLLQVRRFGAGAEGNMLYVFQVSIYVKHECKSKHLCSDLSVDAILEDTFQVKRIIYPLQMMMSIFWSRATLTPPGCRHQLLWQWAW